MALNRTARPLEAGQTRFGLGLSIPVTLAAPCPSPDPNLPCFGEFDPGYLPEAGGFLLQLDLGLDGQSDVNFALSFAPFPMLRIGGKALMFGIPEVLGAFDYGFTLFYPGAGLDAGMIFSFPLAGAEPYLAVRGYGLIPLSGNWNGPLWSASVTVGTRVGVGSSEMYVELSGLVQAYRQQYMGFSILPSIAFRF